ncbi:MAG: hypothetical protein IJS08_02655 [Victivallales bacterium]|nr:hypothetical protein [Victivallales bacterium]
MSIIIDDIPAAERKIAYMGVVIDEMVSTYRRICESANAEAHGWQADSRKTFEDRMLHFEEQCKNLKVRAEALFDAQGEYFRRLKVAEGDFSGR